MHFKFVALFSKKFFCHKFCGTFFISKFLPQILWHFFQNEKSATTLQEHLKVYNLSITPANPLQNKKPLRFRRGFPYLIIRLAPIFIF